MALTADQNRMLNFLASWPSGNDVLLQADLRQLLLETGGSVIARGRLYNIKSKPLGAGVWQVSLELANP